MMQYTPPGVETDWATAARWRVNAEPALRPFSDLLLSYDWSEPDHARWVATAEVAEILDWAEMVRRTAEDS